jgi:hypothetical protein
VKNVNELSRTFPDLVDVMPFTDAVTLTRLQAGHDGAGTDFDGNAHATLLTFFDAYEQEVPTPPTEA